MTCENHSGELRCWAELHRSGNRWYALGYIVGGLDRPEIVVDIGDSEEFPAQTALSETAWMVARLAQENDEIDLEEAA